MNAKKKKFSALFTILFLFSAKDAQAVSPQFDFNLDYAQSSGFVGFLKDASEDDLEGVLLPLLEKNYGRSHLGFTRMGFAVSGVKVDNGPYLSSANFEFSSEVLARASIENPVFLRTSVQLVGYREFALLFSGEVPNVLSSIRYGVIFGSGSEYHMDSEGSEFLDSELIDQGRISSYGIRLEAGYESDGSTEIHPSLRESVQAKMALRRIRSELSRNSDHYNFDRDFFLDWKVRGGSDWPLPAFLGLKDSFLGFEGVLGSEALPIERIPALWSYVQANEENPWASRVGAGLTAKSEVLPGWKLLLRGGLYGGSAGGGISLSAARLIEAEVATWGLQERIWKASLSLRL